MDESVRITAKHRTDDDRGNVYDLIHRAAEVKSAQPVEPASVSPWFACDLTEVE